jgi:hypothetical protein
LLHHSIVTNSWEVQKITDRYYERERVLHNLIDMELRKTDAIIVLIDMELRKTDAIIVLRLKLCMAVFTNNIKMS